MDRVGAAGVGSRHKAAQSPVTITQGAQYLIVHDRSLGRPKTRFGDGPGQKRATRSEAPKPLRNDLHVASIFNYFTRLSQEGAATAGGPELRVNASLSRTPPNWWVVRKKIIIIRICWRLRSENASFQTQKWSIEQLQSQICCHTPADARLHVFYHAGNGSRLSGCVSLDVRVVLVNETTTLIRRRDSTSGTDEANDGFPFRKESSCSEGLQNHWFVTVIQLGN